MIERLGFGVYTKTALLADATTLVLNFPYSDRPNAPFVAYPEIAKPYVYRFRTGASTEKYYGKLNFDWSLNLWDDALFEYLYVTKSSYNPTPLVTVYTKNRFFPGGDKYVAIVARMRFPELDAENMKPVGGRFFDNPPLKFYDGEYAAP